MNRKKLTFLAFFLLIFSVSFSQNAKKQEIKKDTETYVLVETPYGNMKFLLYNDTPLHRENFIKLVKNGFFDGLLFHRVINNFMIQGGDPKSKNAKAGEMLGNGGPGYTIPAEFRPNRFHKKGALAAARQGDAVNPKKESSGSQFYIVQGQKYDERTLKMIAMQRNLTMTDEQIEIYKTIGGTPFLDNDYTVFGEIVEGLDVIDKIATVTCDRNNRPIEDVKMKIRIIE
ncbi:MAG: peptidylprolyl isomerase [Bacteroidales bacterium]|jgi:peptidyl-prolyl cis-trans isomerase B (cyclophilin B)|nr:peptidylprolyl isomerase [Bacteroidales bacterium]